MEKDNKLISLLNETHSWPGKYVFKFVVPKDSHSELKNRTGQSKIISEKKSRTGRFISLTIEDYFLSGKDVLSYYQKLSDIEGLISL